MHSNIQIVSDSSYPMWKSPQAALCKVGLCASGILIILGGLAIIGLLLPHSSIGIFMLHSFGAAGTLSAGVISAGSSLAIATTILAIYLKNKKRSALNDAQSNGVKDDSHLQQFSNAELLTFRLVLKKLHANFSDLAATDYKGKTYSIGYIEQENSIEIEDTENSSDKIKVNIDEKGQIIGIRLNNKAKNEPSLTIPDSYLPLMRSLFKKALEKSSSYEQVRGMTGLIRINICRDGLTEIPEIHLHEFSLVLKKALQYSKSPSMRVVFFNDQNLTLGTGIDSGGLSREFLDDLASEISKSKALSFQKNKSSGYSIPQTKNPYSSQESLPTLDYQEESLYQELGVVLMFCYNSQPLGSSNICSIGRHFDDALFNAALCLTAEEIDTPFRELSLTTKLKICQALVKGYDESIFDRRIELLSKASLNDEELEEAAEIAYLAEAFPDYYQDKDNCVEEILSLENKEEIIHSALVDSLFGVKSDLGYLGQQIAPVHALAQGMKSVCAIDGESQNEHWDENIMPSDFREFSNKIQGTAIDRNDIVEHIIIDEAFEKMCEQNPGPIFRKAKTEIEKKLGWLKEWLIDENEGATEEEIRKFLKFLTGSSSLSKDVYINVKPQSRGQGFSPVPEAHTCTFEMNLSPEPIGSADGYNDHTKEAFIAALRDFALADRSYSIN